MSLYFQEGASPMPITSIRRYVCNVCGIRSEFMLRPCCCVSWPWPMDRPIPPHPSSPERRATMQIIYMYSILWPLTPTHLLTQILWHVTPPPAIRNSCRSRQEVQYVCSTAWTVLVDFVLYHGRLIGKGDVLKGGGVRQE